MLIDALIGGLIGAVLVLIIYGPQWCLTRRKAPSFDAPADRSSKIHVAIDPSTVISKALDAVPVLGLRVAPVEHDHDRNRILLDEPTTFSKFGNFVAIEALPNGNGSAVKISVISKAFVGGPSARMHERALIGMVEAVCDAGDRTVRLRGKERPTSTTSPS
ncbi:MAG: hypothetical protein OEQ29_18020 [Alphaproteobacteria bacterium]|nr:hypothetical protein [Alphaproteobacteria bacterium]